MTKACARREAATLDRPRFGIEAPPLQEGMASTQYIPSAMAPPTRTSKAARQGWRHELRPLEIRDHVR